jgi:hypothetical protein
MFKLSIWTSPIIFFKLTTLEVHIQTFLILTQRHSCALNGCSGDVPTHSLVFTRTHKRSGHVQYPLKGVHVHSQAFRWCSILTQWHSCTLTSIQGVFNTDSKVFMCTHKHSGSVQFWHKWDLSHGHTMVSCVQSWLNGIHAHSMGVHTHSMAFMRTQWVFRGSSILTHWRSCALNGCSGAVPTHSLVFRHIQLVFRGCSHSLISVHAHSQVFRNCSICVQPVYVPEGLMNMFSNLQVAQRPYKLALNFHWMPFLWLCQARRHDVTNP